jgi:hypothetical protein
MTTQPSPGFVKKAFMWTDLYHGDRLIRSSDHPRIGRRSLGHLGSKIVAPSGLGASGGSLSGGVGSARGTRDVEDPACTGLRLSLAGVGNY